MLEQQIPTMETVLSDRKRLGDHTGDELGELAKQEFAKAERCKLVADYLGRMAKTKAGSNARAALILELQSKFTRDEWMEVTGHKPA